MLDIKEILATNIKENRLKIELTQEKFGDCHLVRLLPPSNPGGYCYTAPYRAAGSRALTWELGAYYTETQSEGPVIWSAAAS